MRGRSNFLYIMLIFTLFLCCTKVDHQKEEIKGSPVESQNKNMSESSSGTQKEHNITKPDSITILFSHDTHGTLELCSCKPLQFGGMARRATVITDEKKRPRLVIDLGNLIAGTWPYELLKMRYILRIYDQLGYTAVNMGPSEVIVGLNVLSDIWKEHRVKLISSNAVYNGKDPRIFEPYIITELQGLRVGILGVFSPREKNPVNMISFEDPKVALERILPNVKKDSDIVVLMAYMQYQEAEELGRRFPEIDVVLTGSETSFTIPFTQTEKNLVMAIPPASTYLGRVEINLGKNGGIQKSPDHTMIALDPDVKAHKGTTLIINEYKQELAIQRFDKQGGKQRSLGGKFLGSKECRDCHEKEYEIWQKSHHARAFDTLVARKSEVDPSCVRCHTIGYDWEGGYRGRENTPYLAEVGCENCHGAGERHAKWEGDNEINRPKLEKATPDGCLQCHSWEHSENFEYTEFWKRIKHGK